MIELFEQILEEIEIAIYNAEDKVWCQNRYMDTFYERVYNRLCTLIRKECVEDG